MSDKDSLFGSPPPSPPARGRSPSLALPELPALRPGGPASSQNVGTIALPGSHERCSELPVFIDAALPSEKPPVPSLWPPAKGAPARPSPTRQHVAGSASRRTRSPARRLSPAPHSSQTDRTLRDLVGLISHFEPSAHNAAQRPPPVIVPSLSSQAPDPAAGLHPHPPGTAQNPIVIDGPVPASAPASADSQRPADAVNSALVALAGTVASALKLPSTPKDSSLSKPTVNSVLHIIKHDPKLIPVLQATYEYLGSVPNHPSQPPRSFSNITTNKPNRSSKRKRSAVEKGSQVPAGAGHWDVPFPFAPGQGPKDYPSQWQLDRGRRVLGDLLGLFERAFAQARSDASARTNATQNGRHKKRRRTGGPRSSAESARSDFEGSANGTGDQSHLSPGSHRPSPLDHQRMNEWLSSVPALSASSSIVESTGTMPSPCPSDLAPAPDSLQDLLAMLTPNPESVVEDKDSTFDFEVGFSDVGLDTADVQWQSLFGPAPVSHSINDIVAFPMAIQGDLASQPSTTPSQSHSQSPYPQSLECPIDPVLLAMSQQQSTAGSSSFVVGDMPSGRVPSTNLGFLSAGSDALTSSIASTSQSRAETHTADSRILNEGDLGESDPSDARSSLAVPTSSVSSSQGQSRHGSAAPSDVYAPSIVSSASSSKSSRAQLKAALLAKAQEHRNRLLKAIEEAKTERWETVIEGGVLRNLEKADVL